MWETPGCPGSLEHWFVYDRFSLSKEKQPTTDTPMNRWTNGRTEGIALTVWCRVHHSCAMVTRDNKITEHWSRIWTAISPTAKQLTLVVGNTDLSIDRWLLTLSNSASLRHLLEPNRYWKSTSTHSLCYVRYVYRQHVTHTVSYLID